jgi:hypothetical protein
MGGTLIRILGLNAELASGSSRCRDSGHARSGRGRTAAPHGAMSSGYPSRAAAHRGSFTP